MRVDVFTIFPAYLEGPLHSSLLGRAHERGLVDVRVHDPREHTTDQHRSVDTKLARRRLDDPKATAKKAKQAEPAAAASPASEPEATAAADQPTAEEGAGDTAEESGDE